LYIKWILLSIPRQNFIIHSVQPAIHTLIPGSFARCFYLLEGGDPIAKKRPAFHLHEQPSAPVVTTQFQTALQEALLLSLLDQKLLTLPQYERCIALLKNQK
jgi:hypothetical protein